MMDEVLGPELAKRVKRLETLVRSTASRVEYLCDRLDSDEPLAIIGDDDDDDDSFGPEVTFAQVADCRQPRSTPCT